MQDTLAPELIAFSPLITSMQLSPQRRDDRAGGDWQCGPHWHHPPGALEAARHHSRQTGVRPIPERTIPGQI